MLRPILKLVSASLLLLCLLPVQQALADGSDVVSVSADLKTCYASSPSTLQDCAAYVNAYNTTMYELVDGADYPNATNPIPLLDANNNIQNSKVTTIVITSMIQCTGPSACSIKFATTQADSTPAAPSLTIIGQSNQAPSQVGLERLDSFDNYLIDIVGWNKVTISNFTIQDAPTPLTAPLTVDGSVLLTPSGGGKSYYDFDLYCGAPSSSSTVGSESMDGIAIATTDVGVKCFNPVYVTVYDTNAADPAHFGYSDVNANCFDPLIPTHVCAADVTITSATNLTISGMLMDHSQGDAIDVSGTSDFIFENNTISNSYYRGLTVNSTDASIENNFFFANRAAGLRANLAATSPQHPSDISFNTFDHNQHGDAFSCSDGTNVFEGCSGGQVAIAGSDFVVYQNTFINGFMDFYDPTVFEEAFGYDAFTDCDLLQQCHYYLSSDTNVLTSAGQLWANGGGVESGPAYHGDRDGQHFNPDLEIVTELGSDVVISNNLLDYGAYAVSHDTISGTDAVQISNNEMFENAQGTSLSEQSQYFRFNNVQGQNTIVFSSDNCLDPTSCTAWTTAVAPTIIQVGQAAPLGELSGCSDGANCLFVTASEAWSPAMSSFAQNGFGLTTATDINCALLIYGPGGNTLLTTVHGAAATCDADGGYFVIPESVAEHYTTVQVAYENLSDPTNTLVSAKEIVNLVGMVPSITSTGTTTCSGSSCAWVVASDAIKGSGNCAVGIYGVNSGALITTLTGSSVTCGSNQATFIIPASVLNNYTAVDVNYQNLVQGTWSQLAKLTIPAAGSGGGTGGGGGVGGCGTVTTCQQQ